MNTKITHPLINKDSQRNLMLIPSLNCPAKCKYCFGPNIGNKIMDRDVIDAVINWQNNLGLPGKLEITFHGGEPLVAGEEFYANTLKSLRRGLPTQILRFSMQSNLWLLTPSLAKILRENYVSTGTSLDGSEEITDFQRGRGYFNRTMKGIKIARNHGLNVNCICTFTSVSASRARDIFDFFLQEHLSFSLHSALPSLRQKTVDKWELSPTTYGELLDNILKIYLDHLGDIQISTLNALCQSVFMGKGSICTFTDCFGSYLAVGPDGSIYPCQRFAGLQDYSLGNVKDNPSWNKLAQTPVGQAFSQRQREIDLRCSSCSYLDFCKGGCPYNVLTAKGDFSQEIRDPQCDAYRKIFSSITDRALKEVFSSENLKAIKNDADTKAGLLRQGRLISLMSGDPHPYKVKAQAKTIVAAVALGMKNSITEAISIMSSLGLSLDTYKTENILKLLKETISVPKKTLNNIYIHVTFSCPLSCSHCYAEAGPNRGGVFPVDDLINACLEASELGFRHVVITGGEPLVHPQRDKLLDTLAKIRNELKPLITVLRTSMAVVLDGDILRRIGNSTDEVVVSLDGDQKTHDVRRGSGTYKITLKNLRALASFDHNTDLSIASVLPLSQIHGNPGKSVRSIAKELGIKRVRFRPLLPLGRANNLLPDIIPESLWSHIDSKEMITYGFSPTSSCGIGQNLYVEPDGSSYPCYALHNENWMLGRINNYGDLKTLIDGADFCKLRLHNVDKNKKCRACQFRYLCGGSCRAWLGKRQLGDLDAPPADCSSLRDRAQSLLISALKYLNIKDDKWSLIGL